MKRILFLSLLLSLISLQSIAQKADMEAGREAYERQDFVQAIQILEAVTARPNLKKAMAIDAHAYLARSYYNLMTSGDSVWIQNFPDAPLKTYEHLEATKELDKQRNAYWMIAGIDTSLWVPMYNKGVVQYQDTNYGQAATYFQAASQLAADDYRPVLMLGYAQYSTGRIMKAKGNWEKALELYEGEDRDSTDRLTMEAYTGLINLYAQYDQDYERAFMTAQRAHILFPNESSFEYAKLKIYARQPQLFDQELIQQNFDQALAKAPKEPNLLMAYADFVAYQGKLREGKNIYKDLLNRFPKRKDLQQKYAEFLIRNGAERDARKQFADLIDEEKPEAWLQYAGLLESQGKYEEALEYYMKVLSIQPDNYYANYNIGAYFFNQAEEPEKKLYEAYNQKEKEEHYLEMERKLRQAYPYLKQAHQWNTKNSELTNRLLVIATFLKLEKEQAEYEKLLDLPASNTPSE